jgi:hypothetical protein
MNIADEQNAKELTCLWACVATLRQLPGNRGKGEFLVHRFQEVDFLHKYFRAVYDPRRWWPLRSYDMKKYARIGQDPSGSGSCYFLRMLKKFRDEIGSPQAERLYWETLAPLGGELHETAHSVLDRDLKCGLSHHVLNKAIELAGLEPIDYRAMRLTMSYLDPEQRFCMGVMQDGVNEMGQYVFQVRCLKDDLERWKELGVTVVVPEWIRGNIAKIGKDDKPPGTSGPVPTTRGGGFGVDSHCGQD